MTLESPSRPCFLIVNPTSGSFSPLRLERVVSSLKQSGLNPEVLATGGPDDAALFAARICHEAADPLILVGGGTAPSTVSSTAWSRGRRRSGFSPWGPPTYWHGS